MMILSPQQGLIFVLLSYLTCATPAEREIQERVQENVDHFMNAPILATSLQSEFFMLGGFPNSLQAQDRDLGLLHMYSQAMTRQIKVYYGMESGVFLYYCSDAFCASSREPGESGYVISNTTDLSLQKYVDNCVNIDTGQPEKCRMSPGDKYVKCHNDCQLMPCSTSYSSSLQDENNTVLETKWCRNYTIETVEEDEGSERYFVPRTYHCINVGGQFTQTLGEALVSNSDTPLGDCTFKDGTLVTREISGPYAYCGEDGQVCNTTYTGTYRSRDYDPRYRSWYVAAAEVQNGIWSDPYTFFSTGEIGITWANPIYSVEANGQKTFQGVLAVDYELTAISDFLIEAYEDTDTLVAIFEDAPPNFVVGLSTGSSTTRKVLEADPTQPCPSGDPNAECKVARLPLAELQERDNDLVFQNVFLASKEADFPEDSFIGVKVDERSQADGYYSAISIVYEHPNANLKWRIVVASQIERNAANVIVQGQALFVSLCFIGGLGFVACIILFAMFYRRRTELAVIYSDVRFTSTFILGCATLNLTTFASLGESTDERCMLRMWSFNFTFALAISPLFVKVYRMWKLVGQTTTNVRRTKITHMQAALYSVPIPALQAVILLIFSLVDPPQRIETMEMEGGAMVPNILCRSETDAFMFTQLVFDISLVLMGCLLAFVSRNMDSKFGEPKQMIFSMYNIAFTGVILIVLFLAVDVEEDGKRMLQAIGIFWGTVISSAIFVLPRLIQGNGKRRVIRDTSVSGLNVKPLSGLNMKPPVAVHGAPLSFTAKPSICV